MKIAIGADHRGVQHKDFIIQHTQFSQNTVVWVDVGAHDEQRSDYPVFVARACAMLKEGKVDAAVLLCGSGIGMAIAANRIKGIYAGLVWNESVARQAKEDDNVNVLVIPADFVSASQAIAMIDVWLSARFKDGRYAERLRMID